MNLTERIAWLRRMPLRWKILFGTQALIFTTAINFRLSDIKRARIMEQHGLKAEEEAAAAAATGSKSVE